MVMNVAVKKAGAVVLSFQEQQWNQLSAIARNLSNTNSKGFKAITVHAKTHTYNVPLYNNISNAHDGELAPLDVIQGAGGVTYVGRGYTLRDITPGSLTPTGNALDVGLEGQNAYLAVETPGGVRYTRNGQMSLGVGGTLTILGYPVLSRNGGRITIPPEVQHISIKEDGTIDTENGPVGQLGVFKVESEQALIDVGMQLYDSPTAAVPQLEAKVMAGFLEESNVNPISQIVNMIKISRLYENSQRVVETEYERLKKIVNMASRNGM